MDLNKNNYNIKTNITHDKVKELQNDNVNLDLDKVFQVYLIIFKNVSVLDFLDILQELGEFKVVCSDGQNIAYINTNIHGSKLQEKFDSKKKDVEEIVILGLSLDFMQSIKDTNDRNWCLQRQQENMEYILQKTQKEHLLELSKFMDSLDKEIDKVIQEKEKKG